LDGQLYAAIAHCPVIGGRLAEATLPDDLPGVRALVRGREYVAVVAERYWLARQALEQARIRWDEGAHATLNTAAIFKRYAQALDAGEGRQWQSRGDPGAFLGTGGRRVAAEYRVPFLAHATMEPINCTARVGGGRCELHVGTQVPSFVRWIAAQTAGVPFDAVRLELAPMGGGFGRRLEFDYVREAIEIAGHVPGLPVQAIWSREEDIRRDMYRPAALARCEAVLDEKGVPRAWGIALAGPSLAEQYTRRLHPLLETVFVLPDKTTAEGATHLPYRLPNLRVTHAEVPVPVPVGNWRSVGLSQNAFFVESFVDECARAAGTDPYEYRRTLLENAPRHRKVLDSAARRAGWGEPLSARPGLRAGRGIALVEALGSIVCEVAEVEVDPDQRVRVTRVVAAVDCGLAVDPPNVVAQVRGAIHFGLSAALFGRIDIQEGRVLQSNFHDYRMLTLAQAPRVEVELIESGQAPGGVGEIGVPPIAPAVANAVFAATGKQPRALPLQPS
ncbi:MAG: xanthine dehydrogenase family protein molybdopterin-binding subunit, partial [Burkholderiales bacterium]